MAVYGTKEYLEEKVIEAETRVELLRYALVHKIKESDTVPNVDQLRNACKVIIDACNEADEAKEKYCECCKHERSSEEGT